MVLVVHDVEADTYTCTAKVADGADCDDARTLASGYCDWRSTGKSSARRRTAPSRLAGRPALGQQ